MDCIYLKKIPKNELVIKYSLDDDRIPVKSQKNRNEITPLLSDFCERKLKEDDSERETRKIITLRIDSEAYPVFFKKFSILLKTRFEKLGNSLSIDDLISGDSNDELDSIQELISIFTFLGKYNSTRLEKKYRDYTYYIIENMAIDEQAK